MAFFIEIMQLSKSKNVNNALNKINVHSYVDVLLYLPYKYDDLSLTKENNLKDKERVVILGKIASNFTVQKFKNITLTRFFFTSKNGNTFFVKAYNRPYLNKIFTLDEVATLIGTYDSFIASKFSSTLASGLKLVEATTPCGIVFVGTTLTLISSIKTSLA